MNPFETEEQRMKREALESRYSKPKQPKIEDSYTPAPVAPQQNGFNQGPPQPAPTGPARDPTPPPAPADTERTAITDKMKKTATQNLDQNQRLFLKRVIASLAVQWISMSIIVLIFHLSESAKGWGKAHWWISILSGLGVAGSIFVFFFFGRIRKHFPLFVLWATTFTLALGVSIGILVSVADWLDSLYIGVLITMVIWVLQMLYAWQTKLKFTAFRGFLLTLLIVVLTVLIFGAIFSWLHVGLGGAFALIISWAIYFYALKLVESDTMRYEEQINAANA